jgi:hypothetical protein
VRRWRSLTKCSAHNLLSIDRSIALDRATEWGCQSLSTGRQQAARIKGSGGAQLEDHNGRDPDCALTRRYAAGCSPGVHELSSAYAEAATQPLALSTRAVEAGYCSSFSGGRMGRETSSPPQFGQRPPSAVSVQPRQKVHSKLQIMASVASGGRSLLQHSQLGRSSNIVIVPDGARLEFQASEDDPAPAAG